MEHYELGVVLAVSRIAELRRQADQWRLASHSSGRTAARRRNQAPGSPRVPGRPSQAADRVVAASGPGPVPRERAMLVQHRHEPGLFDPGHCRGCAHQAGLLDHYWQVQQHETSLRQAHRWALAASRRASVALWSAGAAILLAVVALLSG